MSLWCCESLIGLGVFCPLTPCVMVACDGEVVRSFSLFDVVPLSSDYRFSYYFSVQWNLSNEIMEVFPKEYQFHHFPDSFLTKSYIFSLSWKTNFLRCHRIQWSLHTGFTVLSFRSYFHDQLLYPHFNEVMNGVILVSPCPSVRLWTESCPLCIFNNTCWIHFIFTHLIKQLQKVCHV